MRAGHTIELLECGAEYFPALEAAIDGARVEVHVETYILHDDPSSRRVIEAMVRAAHRGVAVRLAVDGFGTPRIAPALERLIEGTTVQLRIFRPEKHWFSLDRRRLRRLHRKLVVIDRALAIIGGINLLDDLIDPNHGVLERPRLDFAVAVRGPLVSDAMRAVGHLWHELESRASLRRWLLAEAARAAARLSKAVDPAARPTSAPPAGGLRAMLLLRDNFRFRRTIERGYLAAIGAARREILIANAYFFPGIRLRNALTQAAQRGVQVTLLLQGRVEYRLQHYASQALYEQLLGAGIRIIEYRASFLHAKVAVIDDWATVGSSNIDPFSLLLAREANVVISDAGFAQHLRARLIAAIEGGGHPVLARHHARRSLPQRLMNWVAFGLLRAGVALSGRATRY
ncbi:MAG TPA: cardiolipin synthase ClsB [Burkholderiaceae bacterium]|nr:cardiolipin synthase ClsB [Burkholderiaceae bacterium]